MLFRSNIGKDPMTCTAAERAATAIHVNKCPACITELNARAKEIGGLAPYAVHGEPAGDVVQRPWGERSFYVVDAWGNDLCFVEEGTLYS